MHKVGDVINIPAKVIRVIQSDGQTTLILQRIAPPEPRGSTADGDNGFAVMWGS